MQSSRSKSTTCPRKWRRRLLRFELNSAATSDGGAQKLENDVRRNSESIAAKVCSQIGRKWNVMFESQVVTSVTTFVNIHLLCYWPTIHYSISKICPKFQIISSHFFEVDDLLDEYWAKIVRSISTPIYVECDKMYRSKVCVQEFSYFVSGLDTHVEKSEYDSPVRKKISCRWRNMTSHISFFSSN